MFMARLSTNPLQTEIRKAERKFDMAAGAL
jgi:hypothetical protein